MPKNPELTLNQAEVMNDLHRSINHFYNINPFTANDGLQRAFHAVVMDCYQLETVFPEMSKLLHTEFLQKDYENSYKFDVRDEKLFGLMLTLHTFRSSPPSMNHFAEIRNDLMEYLHDFSTYFENYDSETRAWVGLSDW